MVITPITITFVQILYLVGYYMPMGWKPLHLPRGLRIAMGYMIANATAMLIGYTLDMLGFFSVTRTFAIWLALCLLLNLLAWHPVRLHGPLTAARKCTYLLIAFVMTVTVFIRLFDPIQNAALAGTDNYQFINFYVWLVNRYQAIHDYPSGFALVTSLTPWQIQAYAAARWAPHFVFLSCLIAAFGLWRQMGGSYFALAITFLLGSAWFLYPISAYHPHFVQWTAVFVGLPALLTIYSRLARGEPPLRLILLAVPVNVAFTMMSAYFALYLNILLPLLVVASNFHDGLCGSPRPAGGRTGRFALPRVPRISLEKMVGRGVPAEPQAGKGGQNENCGVVASNGRSRMSLRTLGSLTLVALIPPTVLLIHYGILVHHFFTDWPSGIFAQSQLVSDASEAATVAARSMPDNATSEVSPHPVLRVVGSFLSPTLPLKTSPRWLVYAILIALGCRLWRRSRARRLAGMRLLAGLTIVSSFSAMTGIFELPAWEGRNVFIALYTGLGAVLWTAIQCFPSATRRAVRSPILLSSFFLAVAGPSFVSPPMIGRNVPVADVIQPRHPPSDNRVMEELIRPPEIAGEKKFLAVVPPRDDASHSHLIDNLLRLHYPHARAHAFPGYHMVRTVEPPWAFDLDALLIPTPMLHRYPLPEDFVVHTTGRDYVFAIRNGITE